MSKNRFVTADHHFGHENILKYCARPFIDEEVEGHWYRAIDIHNETLIDKWNDTVKPEDEVYHLGDLYWINGSNWWEAEQLVRRLNGTIHFIKGDHDPSLAKFRDHGFGNLFASLSYFAIVDKILLIHDYTNRLALWANTLADVPNPPIEKNWRNLDPAFARFDYEMAFCGHVHRNWLHSNVTPAGGAALNVGVDLWHFRPVPWEVAVQTQKDWLEYTRYGLSRIG